MRIPDKLVFGVPEYAGMARVDEKTIRKGIEAQEIPAIRFGRIYKIPRWYVLEQLTGSRTEVA